MKNTRPTYQFDLPLIGGGVASCTLKTPQMKLQSQIKKLGISCRMLLEESNAIYQTTEEINNRVGRSVVTGDATVEAQARAELAAVVAKIDALRDAQDETVIDQLALVTNIPNADDGTPRSIESIDFDEADPQVLTDAVNFFVNGQTK